MMPKLFLGPMSVNTVEAIKQLDLPIGLIPSRRQVEYDKGYTGYSTEELFNSISNSKLVLCRDHAGPNQGAIKDQGYKSLSEDVKYMDIIHIDPWLSVDNIEEGLYSTLELIGYCLNINPSIKFEVGTEEAIFKYSPNDLDFILRGLQSKLGDKYKQVEYACVQSGTGLDLPGRKNTRKFNEERLKEFIAVCKRNGVKSKEHNGDYLVDNFGIATRFDLGLDGINIAPELGQLETEYYLYTIGNDTKLLDKFYKLCLESNKWKKWVDGKISKYELILTSGHYIFNTPEFKKEIKNNFPSADKDIQTNLKELIYKMYKQAHGL